MLPPNPSGGLVCPECGGSGGLVFEELTDMGVLLATLEVVRAEVKWWAFCRQVARLPKRDQVELLKGRSPRGQELFVQIITGVIADEMIVTPVGELLQWAKHGK